MNRLRWQRQAEAIDAALRMIPAGIRARVCTADFFCGVDPIFAGLHSFATPGDGRSYRDTAHVCYPFHLNGAADARNVTVVIPTFQPPDVVVHELGHVLDHALGFDHPCAEPVTGYATTNAWEAFAEAFSAWVIPSKVEQWDWLQLPDPAIIHFFEGLA